MGFGVASVDCRCVMHWQANLPPRPGMAIAAVSSIGFLVLMGCPLIGCSLWAFSGLRISFALIAVFVE